MEAEQEPEHHLEWVMEDCSWSLLPRLPEDVLGDHTRRQLFINGKAEMLLLYTKTERVSYFNNWKVESIHADGLRCFQVKQLLFDENLMLNLLPSLIFRFFGILLVM